MSSGECACDSEHMDECPPHSKTVTAGKVPATRSDADSHASQRLAILWAFGFPLFPCCTFNFVRQTITKKGGSGFAGFKNEGNPWLNENAEKLKNLEKKYGKIHAK